MSRGTSGGPRTSEPAIAGERGEPAVAGERGEPAQRVRGEPAQRARGEPAQRARGEPAQRARAAEGRLREPCLFIYKGLTGHTYNCVFNIYLKHLVVRRKKRR